MDATYYRPKLRWPIDIKVHETGESSSGSSGGEKVLVVQCPLGVAPKPLVLIAQVAPVISLFEGELTFNEILARCASYGFDEQTLRELIRLLDDGLFLANSRFFTAQREFKEAFGNLTVRPPALAGLAYPGSTHELGKLVNGLLVDLPPQAITKDLRCLVAPHIDYRRGGKCYGDIYPHLAASNADVYIVMGTSHQYSEGLFHLSAKDFESPLGRLPCASHFVTKVASRFGVTRAFADEFLHKKEHSLELQLPFISSVKPGVSLAPILVGSFHRALASGRLPHEIEEYETFVCSLVEAVKAEESEGRTVCFIAGVDMAHIGRFFGDEWDLSEERMSVIAARDARYLDAIAAQDCGALFSHVAEDIDARRICGFPTMYTILDVLNRLGERTSCSVRVYDQAVDYQSGCAVTFAGLALTTLPVLIRASSR
jgi:AmmeMemoRadiSam system protein B